MRENGTATITGQHCEQCGTPDPASADGYTDCCNERVCDGNGLSAWAVGTMEPRRQTGTVRACCAAAAEKAVAPQYALHREN